MSLIPSLSVSFTLKVSGTSKTEKERHVVHSSHARAPTYMDFANPTSLGTGGGGGVSHDAKVVTLIGLLC